MATKFTLYANAIEKEKARQFVSLFYNGGRVLSMSSSNFGFEQTLARMHPSLKKIDAYEYDYEVYQEGKRVLAEVKNNICKVHFKYDNIFNATPHKYDFMFLDFCGTMTTQLLVKLAGFLQKFDGTVIITIHKGREKIDKEVLALYGTDDIVEYRERIAPQIITKYTGLIESVPRYEYKNKTDKNGNIFKSPSTMLMYGFQRLSFEQINNNPLLPEEKRNARRYIKKFGFACEIPTTKMAYDSLVNGIQRNLQYATAYMTPSIQPLTLTL